MGTHDLALLPTIHRLYEQLGLQAILSPDDLARGLAQLQGTLRRLAVEAADAEAQGRRLSDAADDDVGFPTLHRLHAGVRDALTMTLPAEVTGWVRHIMAEPESPIADELMAGLARLAATRDASVSTEIRAVARLLLFQAVRINLIVAEHLSGSSIAVVGAEAYDLDRIAEAEVGRWIAIAGSDDEGEDEDLVGVRPLEVLVAAALVHLDEHVSELKSMLARVEDDLVTAFRLRSELELKLRDMEAADAVLIRNAFAPAIQEQRLEVERLQAHHPLVLGERKRAAIDQQVSRLRRRIAAGDWPTRRAPALIDLIEEAEDAEQTAAAAGDEPSNG